MVARPRHVLVTGGSRGIGLAIAQLFAKNSYRCTLISRSEQDLKTAVASLHPLPSQLSTSASKDETASSSPTSDASSSGLAPSKIGNSTMSTQHQHGYIVGNISHGTNFWHASQPFGTHLPKPYRNQKVSQSSHIDVVVNCAGLTQATLFSTLDHATMENIINTNLTALMRGTKFLLRNGYLPSFKKEDGFSPVIINVASLLGLQGGYGAVAYAASKAGVLGFTRALATEYASHKVRVNAIVPGYVETDMTKELNSLELQRRIPLGRFGTPAEIAHAALFLAENQYAHNCVINLDGGLSAV